MATQYLTGVESVYINSTLVPTREEVTYSAPMVINNFAESNQGPLGGVLTWLKEPGRIELTLVHYTGLDYMSLFSDNSVFEVTVNMRSGDSIVGHNCILAEIPQQSAVAGTTEVRFRTMNLVTDLEASLSS